jgi:hypothetical protein
MYSNYNIFIRNIMVKIFHFAEHKTLFTFEPTDIDTYQRDGYIEFQFSDGGYDDGRLEFRIIVFSV